jgi:hypothetical protein
MPMQSRKYKCRAGRQEERKAGKGRREERKPLPDYGMARNAFKSIKSVLFPHFSAFSLHFFPAFLSSCLPVLHWHFSFFPDLTTVSLTAKSIAVREV